MCAVEDPGAAPRSVAAPRAADPSCCEETGVDPLTANWACYTSCKNAVEDKIAHIFTHEWCAALTSVVYLRAPSDKKIASTQICSFQK